MLKIFLRGFLLALSLVAVIGGSVPSGSPWPMLLPPSATSAADSGVPQPVPVPWSTTFVATS